MPIGIITIFVFVFCYMANEDLPIFIVEYIDCESQLSKASYVLVFLEYVFNIPVEWIL